ncbi:MAG TPA: hypothetical protein VNE62_08635 [Actinomycetota bacterium]|nr:hypothetical protein [Actinomycetota bacterium]
MTTQPDRTGILIVRVWMEPHGLKRFRARVTQTLDSMNRKHSMASASSPEELYAAVRNWVESFCDSTPPS